MKLYLFLLLIQPIIFGSNAYGKYKICKIIYEQNHLTSMKHLNCNQIGYKHDNNQQPIYNEPIFSCCELNFRDSKNVN